MTLFFFWYSIGVVLAVIGASFFEWALHRFLMHRPTGGLRYAFERHTLVHHRIFRADKSYHLENEADKKTIPMAWWNGPVLVLMLQVPFTIIALVLGKWAILCGAVFACTIYYAVYEYLHWCMHLPKNRHVERSSIFFRLNGHHLLHHRYMHKNFNVVLPLADFCLGTLLLRSKISFPQPVGAAVPDVQPKVPRVRLA